MVSGVDPAGREELVATHDGRRLWRGETGQEVLAVSDAYAIIRGSKGKTISGYAFARGGKTVWRRDVPAGTGASLTPYAVIVMSSEPDRLVALRPADGEVRLDLRTDAEVYAAGEDGLIAVSGRDMAYLPYR